MRQPPKHFDARRSDFEPYGLTCEIWVPRRMDRADRHNEVELNLLVAGSLTYLLGGRRATVRAGRLAAFWAARPHQIVAFEGSAPYHVVTLPLAWVLGWGLPKRLVEPLLGGLVVEEPDEARADLDRALATQWHRDLAGESSGRREIVLLELKARLLRLAERAVTARGRDDGARALDAAGQGAPALVERMARVIATRYAEPLRVAEIAASVGLHPDYATLLFRKAFGTTPARFVVQHRVSHAQRMLVTGGEKILEIALDAGFRSLGRFNAAFKALCGCTPRDYRRRHRGA
jgi:AraC-like DNA-binding protein